MVRFGAFVLVGLLLGCAGARPGAVASPAVENQQRPASSASPQPAVAGAAGTPVFAEARYGDEFPRSERLPAELGGLISARELRLIVEPSRSHAALPLAKRLAAEHPGLVVIVLERGKDARTGVWLERSGLRYVADETSQGKGTLEELSHDRRLLVPSARASQLNNVVEQGIKRRHYEAYLLHGPWLVWHGAVADAAYPLERAASGAWSRNELETFEDVPRLIREFYESRRPGHEDEASGVVQSLLTRPDVRPKLLLELAESLLLVLESRKDVAVAQAFADRAVVHTHGLEFAVSQGAGLVHYLTGDTTGALQHAERALALCNEVQSDCENVEKLLSKWRRCPRELVERDGSGTGAMLGTTGSSSFETRIRADAPEDCRAP